MHTSSHAVPEGLGHLGPELGLVSAMGFYFMLQNKAVPLPFPVVSKVFPSSCLWLLSPMYSMGLSVRHSTDSMLDLALPAIAPQPSVILASAHPGVALNVVKLCWVFSSAAA